MTASVFPEALHGGWYLLAFTTELTGEVTPLSLGTRALMAVRDDADRVRVFDARCPHRGAHLGYGGKLDRGCVVCPFHGRRIRLGADHAMAVREYPVVRAGEAVFARLADTAWDERGFERMVRELTADRPLVAAVNRPVRVPTALVVENAFDADHFTTVHQVPRTHGMQIRAGEHNELIIDGELETWVPRPGQQPAVGRIRRRFLARAFSPSVVVTEMGAVDATHVVITGGTPTATGSIARVAVAVTGGVRPTVDTLVSDAQRAIDQDAAVWDHLDLTAPQRLDARDRQVLAFRRFVATFAAPDAGTAS